MQTLLAASVFTGDETTVDALVKAGRSLELLHRPDGGWDRLILPPVVKGSVPIGTNTLTADAQMNEAAVPADLDRLVTLMAELRSNGLTKFKADHNLFKSSAEMEMADAICGLNDAVLNTSPQPELSADLAPDSEAELFAWRLQRMHQLLRLAESPAKSARFH
jgi:hypothetical protein